MAYISTVCSKKQNLFITYTTHFRSFQSSKTLLFQNKSLHCWHTLLKINKYYCLYLGNRTRYSKNSNRSEFLMIRTIHCKKLSNLGHQKMCTVKKDLKIIKREYLPSFCFKNKTKKWNLIFTITSLFCIFSNICWRKWLRGRMG